ncbi:MAG: ATP-binding protein [Erysipelotrichaceae bacterium]|nr:ATP-binding protein [Erysipelotrichaceae bacterium]
MLLQFNVTNFLSFKEETILSAYASADKTFANNLIKVGKDSVLPTIAIYGANAAGKSNLIKALTAAILFVRQSNFYQINTINPIVPFLLDENSRNEKTKFDFSFIHNGKQYDYGFSATNQVVYDEYLYEYKTKKPSMIFERTNINEYKYTSSTKKELSQYEEKTSANKLFLATATAWNCELTKNAFMWFAESIDTFDSRTLDNSFVSEFEKDNTDEMKKFMMDFIHHADINISDYNFEIKEADKDTLPPYMETNKIVNTVKQWKMDVVHKTKVGSEIRSFVMPFSAESAGTVKAFSYGPLIRKALKTGKTMIVDEIDSCLHPMLVRYLIDLFNDSEINKNGAQLIFNTHDVSLLDQDIFRRDQIYFVEKDNATAISDLYSLSEFSPRKSEDIRKGYLQGRYGAIPAIIPGGLEW